jgi:hypothetical protein
MQHPDLLLQHQYETLATMIFLLQFLDLVAFVQGCAIDLATISTSGDHNRTSKNHVWPYSLATSKQVPLERRLSFWGACRRASCLG